MQHFQLQHYILITTLKNIYIHIYILSSHFQFTESTHLCLSIAKEMRVHTTWLCHKWINNFEIK